MMESINVRVDDYVLPIDSSRPEDPNVVSIHEEGNTLNIPKDTPPSSDKESTLKIEDTQQHQNDQEATEHMLGTFYVAKINSQVYRPKSNIVDLKSSDIEP